MQRHVVRIIDRKAMEERLAVCLWARPVEEQLRILGAAGYGDVARTTVQQAISTLVATMPNEHLEAMAQELLLQPA